jgi:hypothetical protein
MARKAHVVTIENNEVVLSRHRKPVFQMIVDRGFNIYVYHEDYNNQIIYSSLINKPGTKPFIKAGYLKLTAEDAIVAAKLRINQILDKSLDLKKDRNAQKTQTGLERKSVHTLEEIFSQVLFEDPLSGKKGVAQMRDFQGDLINMASHRYQLFAKKGQTCVHCGIVGSYFAKERAKGNATSRYHFNLYGKDNTGEEVLFTKDHILASSNGGLDNLDNLQTMCFPCNNQKANK